MPRSKKRDNGVHDLDAEPRRPGASPRWLAPTMITLMLIGLGWVVVFYVTQQEYPIPGIGPINLLVGGAIAMVGFVMTTRWR